ncbi:MAG: Gfo/Idh/MocA family oxidoreductase, partial [Bacteroidales bacterium]|nr:Gfo/Idh/MocA family oxidoreductase [Bacteroidales bacterium]
MKNQPSRRKFIKQLGGSTLLLASAPASAFVIDNPVQPGQSSKASYSANDKVRIATVGMGIMGHADTDSALKIPGVELAAVCDLYKGRLARAKEKYGNQVYTTQDYRELLTRKDIDAIIIATSDHWHARVAIDAMNSGKAVYCEKPVVQKISEGLTVIAAQKKTGKPIQQK